MVIAGHIEDRHVVLDEPIDVPDGVSVEVHIRPSAEPSGLCGAWDDERSAEEIIREIRESRASRGTLEC